MTQIYLSDFDLEVNLEPFLLQKRDLVLLKEIVGDNNNIIAETKSLKMAFEKQQTENKHKLLYLTKRNQAYKSGLEAMKPPTTEFKMAKLLHRKAGVLKKVQREEAAQKQLQDEHSSLEIETAMLKQKIHELAEESRVRWAKLQEQNKTLQEKMAKKKKGCWARFKSLFTRKKNDGKDGKETAAGST